MWPHFTGKWEANLAGIPLKSWSPTIVPSLFSQQHMESNSTVFHFKICMPSLHSVWVFPGYTCGMTSQKPHKQQIKFYGKKYSWLVSEETFLCLLNFIRNSQAEAMGHCSPTNQYKPSMHSLRTAKPWSVWMFLGACDPHGATKRLELGQWEGLRVLLPLSRCLLSTLSQPHHSSNREDNSWAVGCPATWISFPLRHVLILLYQTPARGHFVYRSSPTVFRWPKPYTNDSD